MSKKEEEIKLDDDDWKLDFGMDGDDDWSLDDNEPPPTNRQAVGAVVKEAAKGASNVFLSPGRRQKLILDALPTEYTAAVESYDAFTSEARDIGREAREQVIKTSKQLKRQARTLFPVVSRYLPGGISSKINDLIADEDNFGSYNQVDPKEAKIQMAQEAVFGRPDVPQSHTSDTRPIQEQKEDAREAIATKELKEAANQVRLNQIGSYLFDIRNSAARGDGYRTVTTNYRKKVLEVNYRQLFAIQDLTDVTAKAMEKVVPNVERIVHNTMLPDYAKEEFKEIYSAKLKRGIIDMMAPSNFTRDYARVLGQNAKTAISSFFGTVNDTLITGGQAVDLLVQDTSGGEQKSPREQAIEAAKMGGEATGEYLARRFMSPHVKKLTDKLRQAGNDSPGVKNFGHNLKFVMQNLPNILNSYAKGNGNYDGTFSNVLNPLVGLFGAMLPQTQGEYIGASNVSQALDTPAAWTNKNDHTLNEVIPGLLAKIDQSVRSGFMGSEQPLEQYDFETNTFVTTTEVANRIRNIVGDERTRKYVRESIDKIVDTIDAESSAGAKLSDEDKLTLARLLDKKIRNGNHFDIRDLAGDGFDSWENMRYSYQLQSALKGIVENDKGSMFNDAVNSRMQVLRQDIGFTNQRLELARKMYGEQALVNSGALIRNGDRLTFNPDLINSHNQFIGDLELPEYGKWGQANPFQGPVVTSQALATAGGAPQPVVGGKAIKSKGRRRNARSGLKNYSGGKRVTDDALVKGVLNEVGGLSAEKFDKAGINFRQAIALGVQDALFNKDNKHNLYKAIASVTESPMSEQSKGEALQPLVDQILEQLRANNAKVELDNIIELLNTMNGMTQNVVSASDLFDETGKRIRSHIPNNFLRKMNVKRRLAQRSLGRNLRKAKNIAADGAGWLGSKAKATWDWAVEEIPYAKRTSMWSGIKDGFRGIRDIFDADGMLMLSAEKLKQGMYRNSEGKIIKRIKDIDGAVYDAEGNVVFTQEEIAAKIDGLKYWANGKWHAAGELFANAIKGAGGFITGGIHARIVKGILGEVKKQYNKRRVSTDIYIKGEEHPRLTKLLMEKGFYISAKTGKPIRDVYDIDGEVKTVEGNVVISDADVADPSKVFCDVNGKPFKSFAERVQAKVRERLTQAAKLITKPLGWAKKGVGKAFNLVKDAFNGARNWLNDKRLDWGFDKAGTQEQSRRIARSARRMSNRLDDIYNLLVWKLADGKMPTSLVGAAHAVADGVASMASKATAHATESPEIKAARKQQKEFERSAKRERKEFEEMQSHHWQFGGDGYNEPTHKTTKEKLHDTLDKTRKSAKSATDQAKQFAADNASRVKDMASAKVASTGGSAAGVAADISAKVSDSVNKTLEGSDGKPGLFRRTLAKLLTKKKEFDDTEGDGIRDNSARDIFKRRAAKKAEAAKAKKEKAKDEDKKQSGFIGKLLKGFGGLLGGLFSGIFKPLHWIGSMIEKVFDLATMGKRAGLVGALARGGAGLVKGAGKFGSAIWNFGKSVVKAPGTAARWAWQTGAMTAARSMAVSALSTVGTAAIGIVSSPWVIGGALLAGVGYMAYRAATAKRVSEFDQLRYAYYGTPDYEDAKSDDAAKIRYLETTLAKYTHYDSQGFSSLKGLDDKVTSELIQGMGVKLDDQARYKMLMDWMFNRFMPVYLLWTTRVRQLVPDENFLECGNRNKISGTQRLEIAKQCHLAADHKIFKVEVGPFEKSLGTEVWDLTKGLFGGSESVGSELLTGEEVEEIYQDKMKVWARTAKHEKKYKAKARAEQRDWSVKDGLSEAKAASTEVINRKRSNAKATDIGMGSGNMNIRGANGKAEEDAIRKRLKDSGMTQAQIDSVMEDRRYVRDAKYLNAIDAIRVKTYGIVGMEVDKIEMIYQLESAIINDIKIKGGVPAWDGDLEELTKKMYPAFGIDPDDDTRRSNWDYWFNYRFLGTFLKYIQVLKRHEPGADPLNVRVDSNSNYLFEVGKAVVECVFWVKFARCTPWELPQSPFDDQTPLGRDPSITKDNLDYLKGLKQQIIALEQKQQKAQQEEQQRRQQQAITDAKVQNGGFAESGRFKGFSFTEADAKKNPWMASVYADATAQIEGNGGGVSGEGSDSVDFAQKIGSFRDPSVDANSAYGKIRLASNAREDVARMISQVAKVTGVDETLLYTVAMMESSMKPMAGASTSSAKGLYQFITSTWKEQLKKNGSKYGIPKGTSVYDPVANALLGAEYLRFGANKLKRDAGLKHVGPVDIYLTHLLGPGGGTTFIKNMHKDPSRIAALDFKNQAAANHGVFKDARDNYRTYQQVYNALMQRANSGYSNVARYASKPPTSASIGTMESAVIDEKQTTSMNKGSTTAPLAQNGGEVPATVRQQQAANDADAYARATQPAPVTTADTNTVRQQVSEAKDTVVPKAVANNVNEMRKLRKEQTIKNQKTKVKQDADAINAGARYAEESKKVSIAHGEIAQQQLEVQREIRDKLIDIETFLRDDARRSAHDARVNATNQRTAPTVSNQPLAISVGRN